MGGGAGLHFLSHTTQRSGMMGPSSQNLPRMFIYLCFIIMICSCVRLGSAGAPPGTPNRNRTTVPACGLFTHSICLVAAWWELLGPSQLSPPLLTSVVLFYFLSIANQERRKPSRTKRQIRARSPGYSEHSRTDDTRLSGIAQK